jgi:hypothetical protein
MQYSQIRKSLSPRNRYMEFCRLQKYYLDQWSRHLTVRQQAVMMTPTHVVSALQGSLDSRVSPQDITEDMIKVLKSIEDNNVSKCTDGD